MSVCIYHARQRSNELLLTTKSILEIIYESTSRRDVPFALKKYHVYFGCQEQDFLCLNCAKDLDEHHAHASNNENKGLCSITNEELLFSTPYHVILLLGYLLQVPIRKWLGVIMSYPQLVWLTHACQFNLTVGNSLFS